MDMRAKVAYEKAARLVLLNADMHTASEIGACEYCKGQWDTLGDLEGCRARIQLLAIAETLRTYKINS